MIKVHCRTNLDLLGETWPNELPAIPNVGDHIESATKHGIFQLQLAVVRVTWKHETVYAHYPETTRMQWIPTIELGMTKLHYLLPGPKPDTDGSILAFYEWYAPLVGSRPSAFI